MSNNIDSTERMAASAPSLLEQVRERLCLKHYSLRTEQAYVQWIKRYIIFNDKSHPAGMGKREVEAFLTSLAVERNVSASTQSQALSSILFLYREVLGQPLPWQDEVTRAKRPARLPSVLTKDETRQLLEHLEDPLMALVVQRLYGTGMRLLEMAGSQMAGSGLEILLGQQTPDVVYRSATGGGAMIVDKFGGAVEEPPVERSGTGGSSTPEARSEATAATESKAKPGQRRPAASEVECAA